MIKHIEAKEDQQASKEWNINKDALIQGYSVVQSTLICILYHQSAGQKHYHLKHFRWRNIIKRS